MNEQQSPPPPPAGWYPHPDMTGTQRYWDGAQWTEHIAPANSADTNSPESKTGGQSLMVVALVLAGSVIGVVTSMQSASLLTGTGSLWTGVAIAWGAAIAALVLKGSLPTWVRIVTVLAALLALTNVVYVESELEDTRQEIGDMFE